MPPSPPSSLSRRLNAPKPIFIGWFSMVVLAGCGYAYAKSLNTAKKKHVMRESMLAGLEGEERERERRRLEERDAAGGGASTHGGQQQENSPLQILMAQLRRNAGGGGGGGGDEK